jgi:uncharacterized protein involved in exopolysaccharide biosynthesis
MQTVRRPADARGESVDQGYTMEELWAAVRRRARLALIVSGGMVVLGAIVLASVPNEYTAEATIILEPYRPHADLITPAVTTLLEDRLRVARQAILAGPLLEKVITAQNLYPAMRAKPGGLDAAVDNLRRHLEIKPDGDSAIVLGFRTDEREKAAAVVNGLAEGFIAANSDLRQSQARHVLDSIEKELGNVRNDLDGQEAKVRAFRLEHDGELPEQVDGNMHDADRDAHLLEAAQTYLRALEDRRSALPDTPVTPEIEHLATVEAEMVRDLEAARAIDAPDHPERVRLERELKGLRAEKERQINLNFTLKRERREITAEMGKTRDEVTALQSHITKARERAEAGARWATTLTVLERDREMLADKYKSLASRKVESEISLALEQANGPVATRVVDPPAQPDEPSSPDRMKLALVLLVLALGAGAGAGVLAETRDTSLRTPAAARAQLDVPLLAVLPGLKSAQRT